MPTRAQAARNLLEGHDPNEVVAVSTWTADDVLTKAEEMGVVLTHLDAENILDEVHYNQSAEHGINWEVIESAINEYATAEKTSQVA